MSFHNVKLESSSTFMAGLLEMNIRLQRRNSCSFRNMNSMNHNPDLSPEQYPSMRYILLPRHGVLPKGRFSVKDTLRLIR